MTRSQLIREVENDLAQSRARAMLKQPQHPKQTWTEYKAERTAKRRRIGGYILWAVWVMALGLSLYYWGMR